MSDINSINNFIIREGFKERAYVKRFIELVKLSNSIKQTSNVLTNKTEITKEELQTINTNKGK